MASQRIQPWPASVCAGLGRMTVSPSVLMVGAPPTYSRNLGWHDRQIRSMSPGSGVVPTLKTANVSAV
jgi:hypothetical protein